jgi:hypothetical protein
VLLPTADETALLTACLHAGGRARDAWAGWRAGRGPDEASLRDALGATRTLLPLLARSAVRNDLDVGRDVASYMRAAVLREELRAVRYRQIAAEVLAALAGAGVVALVVRGAALAATVYDAWALRHCHDLDLLVRPEALPAAVRALAGVGCRLLGPPRPPRAGAVLRHASGLEVAVHTRAFGVTYYDVAVEDFARGSGAITIDGAAAWAPAREATLVHVLGHATYSPSRRNLRWVTDAWHLMARHAELDWADVVARLDASRVTLPVSVLLAYLAELGAAVPADVVAHLRARAAVAPRAAEDVALGGAHAGPRGDLRSLWRSTASWRGRVRVARWVLAPSPAYLQSAFALPAAWLFPLCYLYRPARFVAGSLVRRAAPPAAAHRP